MLLIEKEANKHFETNLPLQTTPLEEVQVQKHELCCFVKSPLFLHVKLL